MTNRWTPYAKGMDISRYQTIAKDDWPKIKDAGIDFVIAKSGQGDWWKDTGFSEHVQNAYDVDIPMLAYFWFEGKYYNSFGLDEENWPSPEDDRQVNKLFTSIANRKIYGLFIDEEDKDQVTPAWSIAACGQFSHRVRDRLSKTYYGAEFPLGIYTGNWYWENNKAPFTWMANENLIQMGWVAIYPYSKTYVKTTWKDMWELHMPRDDYPVPTLNWKDWKFWQFSGDKFILPGIENGAGGPSALDLNLYNGTPEQLHAFLKFIPKTEHGDPPVPPVPPVPEPEPEELAERVAQLELDAMLMNTKIVELQNENNNLHLVNQEQNERIADIETWIQREL